MSLVSVSDLLRERIGLAPESLGATVLPQALETRMQALGLSAVDDYAARLIHDLGEFQTLVADLTVAETWFFRGGEIFAYLARHIAKATRQQPSGAKYRVLSVPCSSGEEPYSLAIALTQEGVPPASWTIQGVDIDPRLIERARQGRFSQLSFRETAPELRKRYFQGSEGTWELDAAIRSLVHFQEGNLLAPWFLAGETNFDLIFCRNLFIYLHPAARVRALAALDQLLAPQGFLCMGHAESLDSLNSGFVRTGPQPFFLYHRTPGRAGAGSPDRAAAPSPPLVGSPGGEPAALLETETRAFAPASIDLLEQARQQADNGQIQQALDTCQRHLQSAGPSAELFCLMGVLHQARQEKEEAASRFRQALYLEPAHRESLMHLMLLCRELGDEVQATRLRDRLKRNASVGDDV
jgi:chemotaxis protein methyltransferase WspC